MDISKQVLDNYELRKRVIALEGDAAFGFDGPEVEVAVRHKLPITRIVFNDNGIGGGLTELTEDRPIPPNMFVPNARYDRVIEAFGGKGYHSKHRKNFVTP